MRRTLGRYVDFKDGVPNGTKIVVGDTKTLLSRRRIPFTADTMEKPKKFKVKQDEAILSAGQPTQMMIF